MSHRVKLPVGTKETVASFIKKFNPAMMCYSCGADIPTENDVSGIGMRGGIPILYCSKKECFDMVVQRGARVTNAKS